MIRGRFHSIGDRMNLVWRTVALEPRSLKSDPRSDESHLEDSESDARSLKSDPRSDESRLEDSESEGNAVTTSVDMDEVNPTADAGSRSLLDRPPWADPVAADHALSSGGSRGHFPQNLRKTWRISPELDVVTISGARPDSTLPSLLCRHSGTSEATADRVGSSMVIARVAMTR